MNDLAMVRRVLAVLAECGAQCWLFGGWAEELRGLRAPGRHGDVDLLYPADEFAAVERLFVSGRAEEIAGKRFEHKRAFLFDGVMTEVFLARRDARGLHTMFWGDTRYDWPQDTLDSPAGFERPVAGMAALTGFRQHHQRLSVGCEAYLAQCRVEPSR